MLAPSKWPSGLPTAVQQVLKTQIVPAPQGGVNALDMLASIGPTDSIYQYNLIPSQYGCRARTGLSSWATAVGTGNVNTILPYNGSIGANDKLFAAGKNGIFDISAQGTNNPGALVTFGNTGTLAGFGGFQNMATLGGHFMAYCDELNGYYLYTEGTGWAAVTTGQVTGVNPNTFVWPCLYQNRLWMVQGGTATAWYLPTGAVIGAATQFNFGTVFRRGGYLVGLYTWTLDGGNGINDYLVAISSAGDVAIYQGSDPSVATSFSLVGVWYIGPPPSGRRIAGIFGGDIYLLSSYGLLPLSKLIAGILIQNQSEYLSRKINPLIVNEMATQRTTMGWEVRLIPDQNLLLISVPTTVNPYIQFVQSLNTEGWAIYRNIQYNTGDAWDGNFYIADQAGNVNWHTGNTDNGAAINWSMLSSYQEYQEIGSYHLIDFIRPVFLGVVQPTYAVLAKYDYDLSEVVATQIAGPSPGPAWDVSKWDVGLWGGGEIPLTSIRGGGGTMGRAMAIGMIGSSTSDVTLLRFDLMYHSGGQL